MRSEETDADWLKTVLTQHDGRRGEAVSRFQVRARRKSGKAFCLVVIPREDHDHATLLAKINGEISGDDTIVWAQVLAWLASGRAPYSRRVWTIDKYEDEEEDDDDDGDPKSIRRVINSDAKALLEIGERRIRFVDQLQGQLIGQYKDAADYWKTEATYWRSQVIELVTSRGANDRDGEETSKSPAGIGRDLLESALGGSLGHTITTIWNGVTAPMDHVDGPTLGRMVDSFVKSLSEDQLKKFVEILDPNQRLILSTIVQYVANIQPKPDDDEDDDEQPNVEQVIDAEATEAP